MARREGNAQDCAGPSTAKDWNWKSFPLGRCRSVPAVNSRSLQSYLGDKQRFCPSHRRTQGSKMKNILLLAIVAVLIVFVGGPAHAQAPAQSSRKTSTPYTGDLSVFDSPGREDRLQINRVMDILKIAPGSFVADVGAGSGWFTVRASRRVGAQGKVFADDINPEAITYIQKRAAKEGLANVQTILGKTDDPLLPAGKVNAVLLLKTYHEVSEPVELLKHLRESLAPNARIGIIDRNGNGEDHGVAEKIVVDEAQQAGYKLVDRYDFVKADKMDYFLVFETK